MQVLSQVDMMISTLTSSITSSFSLCQPELFRWHTPGAPRKKESAKYGLPYLIFYSSGVGLLTLQLISMTKWLNFCSHHWNTQLK